ncbi:MAG: hypothetical protein BGO76_05850 [Caedibacter sp. 38-128]|nr:aminopeptidase P family protein [Holosporales bacterium]OJX03567.1 MAG: hypothetical protein BGO76_05850 [Caedibacter sp. 38-128]
MTSFQKLMQLRQEMLKENIDAFIIPKADEHQGEYVAPSAERLLWLTGFNGSAGFSIILLEKAALFVDGRYTLQAAQQVDSSCFEIVPIAEVSGPTWLAQHLKPGAKLAYDSWLTTEREIQGYKKTLGSNNIKFSPLEKNLVDQIWLDRPIKPSQPVYIHPLKFAGQDFREKLTTIADELRKKQASASVVTMTESVGWLFNIRGSDYDFIPTTSAYAIIYDTGKADIFIDEQKVPNDVRQHFNALVTIKPFGSFEKTLQDLGQLQARVVIDPFTTPVQAIYAVEKAGGEVLRCDEPTIHLKACKNTAELEGMRRAHIRDGVALTTFLYWISHEGPKGNIDELQAAAKILEYRQKFPEFKMPSFATISGTGPNGAIIHYRVSPETNRKIASNDIYLIDSGGHYIDGCTDVTRTISIGETTQEQRDRFTRVLKGHIGLATSIFPQGTSGSQLDILARHALWQMGLDYAHGTGHGVGAALNIHEGPQRISNVPNYVSLKPGMILSNEPGYYKEGAYGIRIENLVIVKSIDIPDAEKAMLGFETITFAPIDLKLIDQALLTEVEIKWLNDYHQEVYHKLSSLLEPEVRDWLKETTRPLIT